MFGIERKATRCLDRIRRAQTKLRANLRGAFNYVGVDFDRVQPGSCE